MANSPLVAPVNRPLFADACSQRGLGRRGLIGQAFARGGTPTTPGVKSEAGVTRGVYRTKNFEEKPQNFSAPEKVCTKCGVTHPATLDYFRSNGAASTGLAAACRDCDRAKARAWAAANPERARANAAAVRARGLPRGQGKTAWSVESPEAAKEKRRQQRLRRRERRGLPPPVPRVLNTDRTIGRITHRLRDRIRRALGPLPKGHYSLGCTPAELRVHIERQFLKGMSWANRVDWHVDHIRPLASFDLTDPDQLRAACHFSNLRPLWAEDNLRKGATLEVLL